MSFFITFEGGEGTGKTTQLQLLARAFEVAKLPHIMTREPGGTPEAEEIRSLLVNGAPGRWDPVTESLLFYAARTHHARTVIHPALEKGSHVICDRFMDSTLVYQGMAKGAGEDWIRRLHGLAVGTLQPDLTILLDLDPDVGLARTHVRNSSENRFEGMEAEFHRKVRDGFVKLAKAEPERCVIVDAAPTASQVHGAIIAAMRERLGLKLVESMKG